MTKCKCGGTETKRSVEPINSGSEKVRTICASCERQLRSHLRVKKGKRDGD